MYEFSSNINTWELLGSDKKLVSQTSTGFKVHSRDGEIVVQL